MHMEISVTPHIVNILHISYSFYATEIKHEF